MSPLSDEKLREILAGCEGVTPGPWKTVAARDGSGDVAIKAPGLLNVLAEVFAARNHYAERSPETAPTAAHIARRDPQTVAAMAAELLALREREMRLLLAEADAAVFTATPLDLLGIASLFHTDRDYALRLAAAAGKKFDHRTPRGGA